MTTSTRRITENELKNLKDLQSHLDKQNLKFTQAELSELITNYVVDHFDDFLASIKNQKDIKSPDPLYEWINTPADGKVKSNSVQDHDVVH